MPVFDPITIFRGLTLALIHIINLIKKLREEYPNSELLTDEQMSQIARATHEDNLARAQAMQAE